MLQFPFIDKEIYSNSTSQLVFAHNLDLSAGGPGSYGLDLLSTRINNVVPYRHLFHPEHQMYP